LGRRIDLMIVYESEGEAACSGEIVAESSQSTEEDAV
jgi:hypothetical protein